MATSDYSADSGVKWCPARRESCRPVGDRLIRDGSRESLNTSTLTHFDSDRKPRKFYGSRGLRRM